MRILVVEDDEPLAQRLIRGLQEELHTVDLVEDGLEALDYTHIILQDTYDAIILDRILPGLDGVDVCGSWRRDKVRTPILMLTARREIDDRVEGLNAGADDYLTKPFAFAELVARIRALGRRERELRTEVLAFEDLTLDPVGHYVSRNGQRIDLTPREYRILELFLRHPGQVLTRDQIADRAWDLGTDLASNVVDVFVHTLRGKIDGPFDMKLLQTVRGSGYVMRAPLRTHPAGRATVDVR
jgi:DNA-binding response OmpR family regulator